MSEAKRQAVPTTDPTTTTETDAQAPLPLTRPWTPTEVFAHWEEIIPQRAYVSGGDMVGEWVRHNPKKSQRICWLPVMWWKCVWDQQRSILAAMAGDPAWSMDVVLATFVCSWGHRGGMGLLRDAWVRATPATRAVILSQMKDAAPVLTPPDAWIKQQQEPDRRRPRAYLRSEAQKPFHWSWFMEIMEPGWNDPETVECLVDMGTLADVVRSALPVWATDIVAEMHGTRDDATATTAPVNRSLWWNRVPPLLRAGLAKAFWDEMERAHGLHSATKRPHHADPVTMPEILGDIWADSGGATLLHLFNSPSRDLGPTLVRGVVGLLPDAAARYTQHPAVAAIPQLAALKAGQDRRRLHHATPTTVTATTPPQK